MDIEKLKKTLTDNDHWFAIQREKARQQGFYYVEDLGIGAHPVLQHHRPRAVDYVRALRRSR